MTVVLKVPAWPVQDELLHRMKDLGQTHKIPFSLVFAAQAFLDITYVLGPDIEGPFNTFAQQSAYIEGDLRQYFKLHVNVIIQ